MSDSSTSEINYAATDEEEEEEKELHATSVYFMLFAGLLAAVMILSKRLHDSIILKSYVSEASLVLLMGMLAGAIVWAFLPRYEPEEEQENILAHSLLSFSPNVFFMALLPPIIFNSGYQLQRELFYRHLTPIILFSAIGTTVCALSTGALLYGVSRMGLMGGFNPTLLELLTFGALIAATDTVSILSVFQAKKVDPHLFYLVFGESALNDAVALVLFSSLSDLLRYESDSPRSLILRSVGFLLTLMGDAVGCPLLGIVTSIGTAMIFKKVDLREHPTLELPLYMLLMYAPFLMAECFQLSGIVSIFFSGMSARRYCAPNVSNETRQNAEALFKVSAYMAETCIFLELGLSVFGLPGKFNWAFIAWSSLATLIGRALGIYPLSALYNLSLTTTEMEPEPLSNKLGSDGLIQFQELETNTSMTSSKVWSTPLKRKDLQISFSMTHMVWFAGLRGAVAYACVRKFPNLYGHTDEFTAAVMVIVISSIIVQGGLTETILKKLSIEMDIDVEDYMREWRTKRRLKGRFHRFENNHILKVVVRNQSEAQDCDSLSKAVSTDAYNCPDGDLPRMVDVSVSAVTARNE